MDNKDFWVDFKASVLINAPDKEKAKEKFWEIISELKDKYALNYIEVDAVEDSET
jgi:hypothetical protein